MKLLDILIAILILGWIVGLMFHVAGSFIHLLLIIAFVSLIFRLINA